MTEKIDLTAKIKDINMLHPVASKIATELQSELKKMGYDARIIETYRTQERQNYLYEQGRSKPGGIVTKTKDSVHTKKRAFDLGLFDKNGKYLQDASHYQNIGKALENIKARQSTVWGGDWGWDYGHIELSNYLKDVKTK